MKYISVNIAFISFHSVFIHLGGTPYIIRQPLSVHCTIDDFLKKIWRPNGLSPVMWIFQIGMYVATENCARGCTHLLQFPSLC